MKKIFFLLLTFFLFGANSALYAREFSLDAELKAAYRFYKIEDYKKAIKTIQEIEQKGIKDASIALLKYETLMCLEKYPEAKQALLEAVQYDPDCYEAYVALMILSVKDNNPSDAKKYFFKVMEINPEISESSDILYYYAKICILNNNFDEALKNILNAIEIKPDENLYYLELGKIYLYKNDYLKSVNALEYAIGQDENINSECYNYLGLANYKRRNFENALNYFKKAYELNPKSLIYLNNLALTHKSMNNKEEYEKLVSKITSLDPKTPEEFLELSQLLYDRKNYAGAKKVLETGLETYPDNLLLKSAFDKLNNL